MQASWEFENVMSLPGSAIKLKSLIMYPLCMCSRGASPSNIKKVEVFMMPPIVLEHRHNIKFWNWVILATKCIPRTLIALPNDMQRCSKAVSWILGRSCN